MASLVAACSVFGRVGVAPVVGACFVLSLVKVKGAIERFSLWVFSVEIFVEA